MNASYAQVHEMAHPPPEGSAKVSLLPGATADLSAASYCILDEDHTLGNLIRWMVMQNPDVEFCGYSAPHPSEAKIHLRIQMYDGKSSLTALNLALDNLEALTLSVGEKYDAALERNDYDRPAEVDYSFEAVNARLWEQKEARGEGTRDEWEAEQAAKAEVVAEAERAKTKALKKGKPIKVGR